MGRWRVVDSLDDSSRMRMLVLAWSSVYGRAYEIVPARNSELLCEGDGLAPLLDGTGDTPNCEVPPEPAPESGLLGGTSGVKETPDCRISSNLIRISD